MEHPFVEFLIEQDLVAADVAKRLTEKKRVIREPIGMIAASHGLTPGQLSLLWVKDQPGVTAPIIGPRNLEQLNEMLGIADLQASEDLNTAFDELVPPGMAVSNFHNTSGWMKATVWDD